MAQAAAAKTIRSARRMSLSPLLPGKLAQRPAPQVIEIDRVLLVARDVVAQALDRLRIEDLAGAAGGRRQQLDLAGVLELDRQDHRLLDRGAHHRDAVV